MPRPPTDPEAARHDTAAGSPPSRLLPKRCRPIPSAKRETWRALVQEGAAPAGPTAEPCQAATTAQPSRAGRHGLAPPAWPGPLIVRS